ncbi:hypothetical protein BJY04DRAFT_172419 [Aspergillus karnatakaensis]|uniref:Zn(II)2Cys6 transcription factor n=1 Tax=Aspergillus karnatakaensis TaxID=1810916 RepID=UPI003CCCBA14
MLSRRVCDACHARKVRCDRNDPCGNCIDQSTSCTRSRGMKRLPKRDLRSRHQSVEDAVQQQPLPAPRSVEEQTAAPMQPSELPVPALNALSPRLGGDEFLADMLEEHPFMLLGQLDMSMNLNLNMTMNMAFELHSWMSIVPLTDTQMINRRQLEDSQDLTWNGRQALESALSSASRTLGSMEQGRENMEEIAVAEEGPRSIPAIEFLCWMLNDIGSDKFGAFISDYFRHIGKDTLKHMGLSILFNTASPSDTILYTVCVNSVAFKFLNGTLGAEGDDDDELVQRLRHSAMLYRETAKAALKKISLISKPSFTLLQAMLCGIFLHQGSGDTNTCRELAKTACRICLDIGLHPESMNLQQATEEEWYCFMWCYTLDRNYAWKFGGRRILTIDAEPDAIINYPQPGAHIVASKLILLYLDLAKIQDAMIPYLNDPTKATRDNAFHPNSGIGTLLLHKMETVLSNIEQIKPPTHTWKGLDRTSELASLDFAFHSILTNLLHLRQITLAQSPVDTYLDSARRGLKALLTLCASGDRQKTVAYLHWTLLYYPLTPSIALFINTIATSHSGDFAILTAVSDCLAQSGSLSPPVAAMQRLLQEFVALCRVFFGNNTQTTGGGSIQDLLPLSGPESIPVPTGRMDDALSNIGGEDGQAGGETIDVAAFSSMFGDYLGRDEVGFPM